MNLLLDTGIFPVSVLPANSVICEIKYTEDKPRLVAHFKQETFKSDIRLFSGNDKEDAELVNKYTNAKDRMNVPYSKVEIFLKSEWLKVSYCQRTASRLSLLLISCCCC